MNYLKIINRPLKFTLSKDINGTIDWFRSGIDEERMHHKLIQGHIEADYESDYYSLMPLIDQEVTETLQGIIDNTNNNENPLDSAEIINQEQYDTLKATILAARQALDAAAQA